MTLAPIVVGIAGLSVGMFVAPVGAEVRQTPLRSGLLSQLPPTARNLVLAALRTGASPYAQQAELRSAGGASGDLLGAAVAISGDTIVVGAPGRDAHGLAKAGAVYVFTKGPAGWADAAQKALLTATNLAAGDELGASVAIAGSTIVAGAPSPTDAGDHQSCTATPALPTGKVYVYQMPAGGWSSTSHPTAELSPTLSYCADVEFGRSVGIAGKTVVVGAPYAQTVNSAPQGAAFVYTRPAGGWASTASQTAVLTASNDDNRAGLGSSVAISGTTIVAGAPGQFGAGGYAAPGAAYVYAMAPGGWRTTTQTAELVASDVGTSDDFGYAVAVDGSTVVVGAPYHGKTTARFQEGAVYVYLKGAGWAPRTSQTSELYPSDPHGAAQTNLGLSVAVSGRTVVGGPVDDAGANGSGATYVFSEPVAGWPRTMSDTQELAATPAQHGSYFGSAVAVSAATVVVGADEADPAGVSKPPSSGLVYVYGPSKG